MTPAARSPAVDPQVEEMGGAGDARVIVPDRLLASAGQPLVVEVEPVGHETAQVVLDGPLVLRGWRDDARAGDGAVGVYLVPVVEHPAGGLGDAVPRGCPGGHGDGRPGGRAIVFDQPQRLLDRADDLDRAHDDAAERIAALGPEPGLGRGVRRRWWPASPARWGTGRDRPAPAVHGG